MRQSLTLDELPMQGTTLQGQTALITGGAGGIGRAVAAVLAAQGAQVTVAGRNTAALAQIETELGPLSPVVPCQLDLTSDQAIEELAASFCDGAKLDILVHAAGVISQGTLEDARIEDFDRQYATNVRGPYYLTKCMLPFLRAARGHVVFLNSTAGLSVKRPEVAQYSASKHALRALADSLREELNPMGIRVTSVYLGRTATPMQERIFREEHRSYCPEQLLQPSDVASTIAHIVMLPPSAEVTDITLRPALKSY